MAISESRLGGGAGKDPAAIGIDALSFIASHDDLMNRFLDLSGLTADQIRGEVKNPSFFVGLLDFILANEDDVVDFASVAGVRPTEIGKARNQLAIAAGIPPEDYPSEAR